MQDLFLRFLCFRIRCCPKYEKDFSTAYNHFKSPFIDYTKMIGDIDKPCEWYVKRELIFRDTLDISLLAHTTDPIKISKLQFNKIFNILVTPLYKE